MSTKKRGPVDHPDTLEPLDRLVVHPLTEERWDDLEDLFGERGACGGCWCMAWRVSRSQYEKQKGAGNKRALKRMVKKGEIPGILAYSGGRPIGWCSLAPRETYPVLGRSRILRPVDEAPVWSVVCFFVAKPYRRRGVSVELLRASVRYAKRRGARILEGYPVDPHRDQADVFVFTGLKSAFVAAGFTEVARRSPTRPIMRYQIR